MTGKGPSATIRAQAKLNLALRVLSRDDSGYHPLETLFIRLDLADTVTVKQSAARRFLCSDPTIADGQRNLASIAAERYSAATGWPQGWDIHLEKNIPIGAGLGGGSADAGAVLRALNSLSPKPVSQANLSDIGATIGADVPFMTGESAFALGEGYGEKLTDMPPPPKRTVGLAIPAFQVTSRDAYSWIDSDGAARADRPAWDLRDLSWPRLDQLLENDFTAVVSRRHPEIPKLIEWFMSKGAAAAGMTGSGSVVFGLFDRAPDGGESLPVEGKLLWTRTASRVVEPRHLG